MYLAHEGDRSLCTRLYALKSLKKNESGRTPSVDDVVKDLPEDVQRLAQALQRQVSEGVKQEGGTRYLLAASGLYEGPKIALQLLIDLAHCSDCTVAGAKRFLADSEVMANQVPGSLPTSLVQALLPKQKLDRRIYRTDPSLSESGMPKSPRETSSQTDQTDEPSE